MRVLHLRTSNFYGGPERQIHHHLREAREHGLAGAVGTFRARGEKLEWLEPFREDNLRVVTLDVLGSYDPVAVPALARLIRTSRIDLVCTHDYRTSAIAALAVRSTPARWIAFSRGSTRENLRIRALHTLDLALMRTASRIVAVSRAQARRLYRALISRRHIVVVHNAVAPEEFERTPPMDLRERFGLPRDSILAVAGGRLSPEKGQSILVQSAALLARTCPELRLILFGEGPDLTRIRSQAKALGVQDRLLTPGFEANMIGALKGANFAVNPSLSEGLPNILLEAMSVHTPVVATSVGGVPELVQDGITGSLAPPGNPHALAEVMHTACKSLPRMMTMADCAYVNVVTNFSFGSQYRALAALYEVVWRTKK